MSTTGRGLQIEYPSISLHAISRAAEPGTASIYCQLDEKNAAGPLEDAGGGHDDDDEDATGLRELCIFPTNESARESTDSLSTGCCFCDLNSFFWLPSRAHL
jgi:chloride channel, nucleotide-sensitive, 1A